MLTKAQALDLLTRAPIDMSTRGTFEADTWSDRLTLDGGYDVRVKLVPDYDSTLEGSGDWYGNLYPCHREKRPSECNGAARKIQTRDGTIWWQPPEDLVSDPENLAKLEARVRGYFREDWCYVGAVLEMRSPACECCSERKTYTASLWAIESDAGEYFAEVLTDLSSEAAAEAKEGK